MNRYIFIKTAEPECQKCIFVEESVAKCNENILKAKEDCEVSCLKVHGYYGIVREEDVNKEKICK